MPFFVRVKDKTTKHQFDVPETDPRIGKAFELVNSDRYPRARTPRPPKHHVPNVSARPARPVEQSPSDDSKESDVPAAASADATETPESKPARANSRK